MGALCTLCPRGCKVDREAQTGYCGQGGTVRVARAALHHWEEPCISGTRGSGTVFFAGCGLRCVYCQNHAISFGGGGTPHTVEELADVFLTLQGQGAHNLNLVTASHFRPQVVAALRRARAGGLAIPVVWNTGGYETGEAIAELAGLVDVWLFDVKYHSPALAKALSNAGDYFKVATGAAKLAQKSAGPPVLNSEGLLERGFVLRLLVLPGHHRDAMRVLDWAAEELPGDGFLLSLMSQYTPMELPGLPKELQRRLASYEYRQVADHALELGLENGYLQQRSAAGQEYIPPFEDRMQNKRSLP